MGAHPTHPVGCAAIDEHLPDDDAHEGSGRLRCPFCEAYEVNRLYLASVRLDSCDCRSCGARWDEEPHTGAFRGRASRSSVVVPRDR